MDHNRFDELTRWLAFGSSRRAVLRSLAAGALAVGLGLRGREEAAAKCVNPGKKCKSKNGKKQKCCGSAKCKGKKCKCTGGKTPCGQTCCQEGQLCAGAQCVTGAGTCPTDGADNCNNQFTDACNDDPACRCYTTMANATRCGKSKSGGGSCGVCTTDADCVALGLEPGAFCAKDTGTNAYCGCATGDGFCRNPCSS